ncbi:MAG TPA: hypothetical protein VIK04_05995 [Solirubrobacteraceae bacterium]
MTSAPPAARPPARARRDIPWARLAPTLVAAAFAAGYVIVAPPSLDLAAHLYRAHLFSKEGFGIWDDYWYSGHHIVGYSVLYPAVSAALTPQLAAAIAATGTAALFEPLARRHFGPRAWLGAVLFGAATAIDLYTGRLALAFGALPALGAIAALDTGAGALASALAVLCALCSPVAALFAALAASGYAVGALIAERRIRPALPAVAVVVAALAPVLVLAVVFPEGGTEPFGVTTLIPLLVIAAGGLGLLPGEAVRLRAGIAIYAAATVVVFLVPSPIGSNIARLGTFMAAPLAALIWWRRRMTLLAIVALPLLYVGWLAPVSDVATASGDPTTSAAYYRPLLRFLRSQARPPAAPFRIEIPFTRSHWEAYRVASSVPIARGWERQLDIADNPIFYRGHLTAAAYATWLHRNAIRFVAASDAALDYSAQAEMRLIDSGPPYLRLVMRSAHWRVYAVTDPTPIAQGVARLTAMGADSLALHARSAGSTLLHVRFSPYWELAGSRAPAGCVAPAGDDTRVTVQHAGPIRLVMGFSLGRIGARSPRCN